MTHADRCQTPNNGRMDHFPIILGSIIGYLAFFKIEDTHGMLGLIPYSVIMIPSGYAARKTEKGIRKLPLFCAEQRFASFLPRNVDRCIKSVIYCK